MIINANKSLFLGTRKFTSKKITENEFKEKLFKLYERLNNEASNNALEIISVMSYLAIEKEYKELEKLKEDMNEINGCGLNILNLEFQAEQGEIKTLSNGFTYIEAYSSVDDKAIKPIFNIYYFDEYDNLRLFCPYCGNLVNVGAVVQMCAFSGSDEEIAEDERLFCKNGYDICDEENYFNNFLKAYGKEYGCIGISDNFDELEFDKSLMLEDILSNVILK